MATPMDMSTDPTTAFESAEGASGVHMSQIGPVQDRQDETNRYGYRDVTMYPSCGPTTAMDSAAQASGSIQMRSHSSQSSDRPGAFQAAGTLASQVNRVAGLQSDGKNSAHHPSTKWANKLPEITAFIPLKKLNLPFAANKRIGYGRNGEVVLSKEEGTTLLKYQLQADGSFELVWTKPLPQGFTSACYKRIYDNGDILLQETEDGRTDRFNEDLEFQESWQEKGLLYGNLSASGTDSPGRPVYKLWQSEGRRQLQIYKPKLLLRLVDPNQRYKWRGYLSLCESQKNNRIVVLGSFYKTLDFFDYDGKYLGRTPGLKEGIEEDGVCCNDEYIFVACDFQNALHIFNWYGDPIGHQKKKQLGLDQREKICSIQYNPSNMMLIMAVGDHNVVRELRSFEILQKFDRQVQKEEGADASFDDDSGMQSLNLQERHQGPETIMEEMIQGTQQESSSSYSMEVESMSGTMQ